MSTGRKRLTAPDKTASITPNPSSRSRLKQLTITMPLSTATPLRAMNPIAAVMLKGMPRNHSASTPPVTASGIPE